MQNTPFVFQANWQEHGKVLEARGPYKVYHNTHADRNVAHVHDPNHNHPDTNVHPEELKAIVQEAMDLAEQTSRKLHDEL